MHQTIAAKHSCLACVWRSLVVLVLQFFLLGAGFEDSGGVL